MALLTNLKKQLRPILDSKAGLRIRVLLNTKAPLMLKPGNGMAPVSDMFFWKQDACWDTVFNLTNIGTSILPEEMVSDHVICYIWDAQGNKILEKTYDLAPHAMKRLYFKDFKVQGQGSFACFHDIGDYKVLLQHGSHIVERGYVGYRRDNGLWNFLHGNLHAAYYDIKKSNSVKSMLLTSLFKKSVYKPQVRFDDCDQFSLVFINSSHKKQTLSLELRLSSGNVLNKTVNLEDLSTKEVLIDNPGRLIQNVFIHSKIILCRPIIMKYYSHYFDIFHA